MNRREAEAFIAALIAMREDSTDKQASKAVPLFPKLKEGGDLVKAGTRINWNRVLKRAAADLWDTAENNPDNAPGLWEDIDYKDGFRLIPEVITAGLAFALDEKGWWSGKLYRSAIPANTYTPEQYPAGWELEDGA